MLHVIRVPAKEKQRSVRSSINGQEKASRTADEHSVRGPGLGSFRHKASRPFCHESCEARQRSHSSSDRDMLRLLPSCEFEKCLCRLGHQSPQNFKAVLTSRLRSFALGGRPLKVFPKNNVALCEDMSCLGNAPRRAKKRLFADSKGEKVCPCDGFSAFCGFFGHLGYRILGYVRKMQNPSNKERLAS